MHRVRPVDGLQLLVMAGEVAGAVEELLGHDRRPQPDAGRREALPRLAGLPAALEPFPRRGAAELDDDRVVALPFLSRRPTRPASKVTSFMLAAQLSLAAYRIQQTQDLASRLLNTENTPLPSLLAAGAGSVNSVAFSPDGHTLAAGANTVSGVNNFSGTIQNTTSGIYGFSSTIQLWDVTDPMHPYWVGQALTGASGTAAILSVAFSPDGHALASGSDDGTTRLWNLNIQHAISRICAVAGGLTPQQWHEYIRQPQYQTTCVH
jgi:hypothetical protein